MGPPPVEEVQKTSFDISSDILSPALKEAMGFKLAQREATPPKNADPVDKKWLREELYGKGPSKETPAAVTPQTAPGKEFNPDAAKQRIQEQKDSDAAIIESRKAPQRRATDTQETPEERATRMMKLLTD